MKKFTVSSSSNNEYEIKLQKLIPNLEETKNKKIAQLTKVIFHLNSQIESHDEELYVLRKSYENEMQQVIQDCYEKIDRARLKSQDWQKKALENTLYTNLKLKYQSEKDATLKQIETLKSKQSKSIARIKCDYQNELKQMIEETGKLAHKIQFQTIEFTNTLTKLKKSHETGMKNFKEKHESDKKLMQQKMLSRIEQLKNEYNTSKANTIESNKNKLNQVLYDHKCQIQSINTKNEKQIDKMSKTCQNKDKKISELEQNITSYKDDLTTQTKKVLDLEIRLRNTKTERDELETENTKMQESNDMLRQQLNNKDSVITSLKNKIKMFETGFESQTADLDKLSIQIDILTNEKLQMQRQLQTLQTEINEKNQTLVEYETQLKDSNKLIQTLKSNNNQLTQNVTRQEVQLGQLRHEISNIEKKFKSSRQLNTSLVNKLRKISCKLVDTKVVVENEKKKLGNIFNICNEFKAQAVVIIQQFRLDFIEKYEKIVQIHRNKIGQLQLENEVALTNLHLSKSNFEASMSCKMMDTESKLASTRDKCKSMQNQINLLNQSLNEKNQTISLQSNQLTTLQNSLKSIENEYQLTQSNSSQQVSNLKNTVSSFQTQLEETFSKLNHTKKLHEIENKSLQEKVNQLEAHNRKIVAEKSELWHDFDQFQSKHNMIKTRLENQISKNMDQYSLQISQVREEYQSKIIQLNKDHQHKLSQLQLQHDKQIELLQSDTNFHNEKVEKAIGELKHNYQTNINTLKEQHKTQLLSIETQSQKDKLTIKNELTSLFETELEKKLEKELSKQQRRLVEKFEDEKLQLESNFTCENESLIKQICSINDENARKESTFHLTVNKLENDIKTIEKEYQDKVQTLEKDHFHEKEKLLSMFSNEKLGWNKEKESISHLFQSEKQSLIDKFSNDILKIENDYKIKMNQCNQQFEKQQLKYSRLKKRFDNREPRQQDLAKIDQLEQIIKKQQISVNQANKDMKRFKMELLNREENYNKVFGRSPTVGVMNVKSINSTGSSMRTTGVTQAIRNSKTIRPASARKSRLPFDKDNASDESSTFPPLRHKI